MKAERLKIGDKVAIVSLSSGILGEPFIKHELDLGVKRLKEFGLIPVFMENSLKGIDYLKNHPEARAEDLKQAFASDEIKAVICAIGGDDAYKTIPYLLNDEVFKKNIKSHPKIFTGYSDSTTHHILLYKLGLNTFYGPALITDFAEFEKEMLPYTKNAFSFLFNPVSNYEIKSSEIWYDNRTDFSPSAVGTKRISHKETRGYELLQGSGIAEGSLLGGCIEILSLLAGNFEFSKDRNFSDECRKIIKEYSIFPTAHEWKNKIMFLETSDEKPSPNSFRQMIKFFKEKGIFNQINGLLIGKPIDEVYYEEYKQILKEELNKFNFPILINLNFGHSYPRMVLPYGVKARIDADNKKLIIVENPVR